MFENKKPENRELPYYINNKHPQFPIFFENVVPKHRYSNCPTIRPPSIFYTPAFFSRWILQNASSRLRTIVQNSYFEYLHTIATRLRITQLHHTVFWYLYKNRPRIFRPSVSNNRHKKHSRE